MKYTQPLKACWLIILIPFITAFHGCAAKGSVTSMQQGAQVVLTKIEPRDMDGKTEITIEATEPILQYTSFQLSDPLRLVIDIADSSIGKLPDRIAVNSGGVTDITPSQKDNVSRLEFSLSQSVETKVYQSSGKLVVELSKPAEEAPAASEAVAPATQTEVATSEVVTAPTPTPEAAPVLEKMVAVQPEQEAAKFVTAVSAIAGKDGVQVIITGDGAMKPNAFLMGNKKLVVDIPGVQSRVRPSVIPVRKGGLDKVRVGQHPAPDQKVRVVLDLTKTLSYNVTPQGNTVLIAMSEAPAIQAEQTQPQEKAVAQEQETPVIAETQISAQASTPVQQSTPPTAAAPQVIEEHRDVAKHETAAAETSLLNGGSRFTGRKISLDLQDADIVNVMRLFAEVGI